MVRQLERTGKKLGKYRRSNPIAFKVLNDGNDEIKRFNLLILVEIFGSFFRMAPIKACLLCSINEHFVPIFNEGICWPKKNRQVPTIYGLVVSKFRMLIQIKSTLHVPLIFL